MMPPAPVLTSQLVFDGHAMASGCNGAERDGPAGVANAATEAPAVDPVMGSIPEITSARQKATGHQGRPATVVPAALPR
jgi:hypothetical protein